MVRLRISFAFIALAAASGCNALLGNDDGFLKPDASGDTTSSTGGAAGSGTLDGPGAGGAFDGSAGSSGSGSGGTAEQDGGHEAAPPVCAANATRCSAAVTNALETCTGTGQWGPANACPYVCANDKCGGECTPGDKQCDVKTPTTCGTDGTWMRGSTCGAVCSMGTCVDSCTVGMRQCSNLTPQRCEGGVFVDEMPCTYLCKAGSCAGMCLPNTTRCTNGIQETCDASGQWTNQVTCPFVCAGAVCGGMCKPGTTTCSGSAEQTCGQDGKFGATTTCPFPCSGAACGVCSVNDTHCKNSSVQETCASNNQWANSITCPNGCIGKSCAACAPNDTRCTNGTQETCGANGTWGMSTSCALGCGSKTCVVDLCSGGDCTALLKTVSGLSMDGWASIDAPVQAVGSDGIEGDSLIDGVPSSVLTAGTPCQSTETRADHGLPFKQAHWKLQGPSITAGTPYQVTLHFTGVTDCKTYQSLAQCPRAPNAGRDAKYDLWCPGGTDPAATTDHYDTIMISVTPTSSAGTPNLGPIDANNPQPTPGNWWMLNECPTGVLETHQTWMIDFMKTITVPGGSWINFTEYDTNCREILDCGNSPDSASVCVAHYMLTPTGAVPSPPPSITNQPAALGPNGGYGRWIYFDVTSVHL